METSKDIHRPGGKGWTNGITTPLNFTGLLERAARNPHVTMFERIWYSANPAGCRVRTARRG